MTSTYVTTKSVIMQQYSYSLDSVLQLHTILGSFLSLIEQCHLKICFSQCCMVLLGMLSPLESDHFCFCFFLSALHQHWQVRTRSGTNDAQPTSISMRKTRWDTDLEMQGDYFSCHQQLSSTPFRLICIQLWLDQSCFQPDWINNSDGSYDTHTHMWNNKYQNDYMLTHRAITVPAAIENALRAENHAIFSGKPVQPAPINSATS